MLETAHLTPLIAFFDAHRADWICGNLGDWAVVSPAGLLGFYGDFEAAYLAAADAFGHSGGFLLKEVIHEDRVEVITRLMGL